MPLRSTPIICPRCKVVNDASTQCDLVEDADIRAGDYTLCVSCGTWIVMVTNYKGRIMTKAEYLTQCMESDPAFVAAENFILTHLGGKRERPHAD